MPFKRKLTRAIDPAALLLTGNERAKIESAIVTALHSRSLSLAFTLLY
jgi:hypothetical protein